MHDTGGVVVDRLRKQILSLQGWAEGGGTSSDQDGDTQCQIYKLEM